MKKLLYLAGPISANPNAEERFRSAVKALESAGYAVRNPFGIDPACYFKDYVSMIKEEKDMAQLKADLIEMLYCDGVATLPLTHSSRGTARELALAFSLDMDVWPIGEWLKAAQRDKEGGS